MLNVSRDVILQMLVFNFHIVTAQRWQLSFTPPAEQSLLDVVNKKRGEKKSNDDQAFSWPDEHDASFTTFCSEDITLQMQLS